MTMDRDEAARWMTEWAAVGMEGIVAKPLNRRYEPWARGWRKIRLRHSTEAIVGAVTGTLRRPTGPPG